MNHSFVLSWRWLLKGLAAASLLLSACGGGQNPPAPSAALQSADTAQPRLVTYMASDENFPNPERGQYIAYQPGGAAQAQNTAPIATPGVLDYFKRERIRSGATVVRAVYVLGDWRTQDIAGSFLQRLQEDFDALRAEGFKMIPYFAYNWPTSQVGAQDASASQIERHLAQLKPVLSNNADLMPFMIAGLIGAWGEWHTSSNNNVDDQTERPNANTQQILNALLAALPPERMVALRYVDHKQYLYGSAALGTTQAFDRSAQARLGFHNECFMSDRYGEQFRAQFHDYLKVEGLYVPHLTALDVDCLSPGQIVLWDDLMFEAQTIGLDVMADIPDLSRLSGTSRQDELLRRLGYRFALTQAQIPPQAAQGQTFNMQFDVTNSGFSALYNPRPVQVVLRHQTLGTQHVISLTEDPRLWQPGKTKTVNVSAALPADLAVGAYDVLLRLPDASARIAERAEYAIRLANADVWESATGSNKLFGGLQIVSSPRQ